MSSNPGRYERIPKSTEEDPQFNAVESKTPGPRQINLIGPKPTPSLLTPSASVPQGIPMGMQERLLLAAERPDQVAPSIPQQGKRSRPPHLIEAVHPRNRKLIQVTVKQLVHMGGESSRPLHR